MSLDLNISAAYANKPQTSQPVRVHDDETAMEGLTPAQKETFNLARKAKAGDNAWDKAILNLVHPPALMLFALLDSGRQTLAPPLPQVQDAYTDVSKTPQTGDAKDSQKTAVSKSSSDFAQQPSNTVAPQVNVSTVTSGATTISYTTQVFNV